MDDWTLRENSDSPVGVNGFVDNMQMLWKFQSLDSLMPANDNDAPESFNEFNQSASTDFPDSDELVEKLFLESMAMQQQADIQNEANQDVSSDNLLLESLLNATKDDNDMTTSSPSETANVPEKRSSSPSFDEQNDRSQAIRPKLLPAPSSLPIVSQQQPSSGYFNASPIQLQRPIQEANMTPNSTTTSTTNNSNNNHLTMSTNSPIPVTTSTSTPTTTTTPYQKSHESVPPAPLVPISLSATPTLTTVRLPLPNNTRSSMTMPPPNTLPSSMLFRQLTTPLPTSSNPTPMTNGGNPLTAPMPSGGPLLPGFMRMNTGSPVSVRKPIPPRPQLRIHLSKRKEVDPSFYDDPKDPMKPDLDVSSLRRLTVATLRTLGVYLSLEELPEVQIEDPLPTDSQQVLPVAAMQLITTMVLGTSGDKEVSQTLGSQISNGDLVALQRMIVAGLRSKNIVIHTVLTDQSLPASKTDTSPEQTLLTSNHFADLSQVKYEPPHNVTRLFLRLYRFIINMLLSTPDCWPFIQPVPASAFVYHQEIKQPMDLQTIEENVWAGKYTKFARFEKDIRLIWKNARAFHNNTGTIPKHADCLEKLFNKIVVDIKKQISTNRKQQQVAGSHDFKFDPANTLPEESDFSYPPLEQVFSEHSTVYAISALSPLEPKGRKPVGLTDEKLLYLQLNGPFFQAVEQMKSDPKSNHSIVPRFYIAKNRTLLRQIRSQGVLAIFYNTKTSRVKSTKLIRIETDMILAYPASDLFDIDQINEYTEDFAPKAWIHLRPLRVVQHMVFEVNEAIERDYFKRMFATSKMSVDSKGGHSMTKKLLKKVVRQILGLPDIPEPLEEAAPSSASSSLSPAVDTPTGRLVDIKSLIRTKSYPRIRRKTQEEEAMDADEGSDDEKASGTTPKYDKSTTSDYPQEISNLQRLGQKEITHDVWKRLFHVCASKGIMIRNISDHGHINWHIPSSEGFFKRVYFLQDTVVQVFRQMTMYQRITEVACLMKLRNLPHMAQAREILFNDNGDVAGLSMERYQTTLKQYTHVHTHHRLSAYQKYDVIYQMLVCMKTIHEAGLAHRDLSEVNIMVNTVEGQYLEDGSEKVCLYLIDFGKAVFCQPEDVRDWFVDVPRAEWEYDGDVVPETKEELDTWCETLPWVKGKPDHGYRMYRSIQTLPKTRSDNQVLPWLIHPQAEDMYSIGVMIWKVFTDTEPWRGILDTDLQGLRYVAQDDYRIQRALEGEVHGELSRQLLLKCLRTRPQDRETARDILDWISQEPIKEGLIGEWKMYSSDTRSARRAKTFYGFEDEDDEDKKKPRKKANTMSKRGRPKAQKELFLN